jgi:hypothetical protein
VKDWLERTGGIRYGATYDHGYQVIEKDMPGKN